MIKTIVESVLIAFCLICIYFSFRNEKVYNFRIELIDREYKWINENMGSFKMAIPNYYVGLKSLPSYEKMVYRFWVSLNHYTTLLKPYNEYYSEWMKK